MTICCKELALVLVAPKRLVKGEGAEHEKSGLGAVRLVNKQPRTVDITYNRSGRSVNKPSSTKPSMMCSAPPPLSRKEP